MKLWLFRNAETAALNGSPWVGYGYALRASDRETILQTIYHTSPGGDATEPDGRFRRFATTMSAYLATVAGTILAIALVLTAAAYVLRASLTQVPMPGKPEQYRDYGGRTYPEIADQDLFYQNIGPSVSNAKRADIVILGPSFSAYAFDRDVLHRFESETGLHVFNMSFIGIRGGEFSRRVIERWGIHAPLWIINADDQFIHFFSGSTDLTLGPKTEPITALELGRVRGFLRVAWRVLRWRYEDWQEERRTGASSPNGLYRDDTNGNVMLDINPKYVAKSGNPVLSIGRDPDCHSVDATAATARRFMQDVGGQVVLTVVPHSQYCPTQAQELAKTIAVDLVLVQPTGMSTIDGGGHLDKRSATIFTEDFLAKLISTKAYAAAFSSRQPARAGLAGDTTVDAHAP